MTRQTTELCAADTRTDWALVEETREREAAVANHRRATVACAAMAAAESKTRDKKRGGRG